MAVSNNGINGYFNGKVGSVVGFLARGQQIIRSLPRKRTSPPTAKELLNRQKFAASQAWLSPLTDFLRIGFKDYQPTYQGFVAAKAYNQKNAMAHDQEKGFYIDPALALVSFGKQLLPQQAQAVAAADQEIVFNWSTEVSAAYNDQTMLLAYAIETRRVAYLLAAGPRNAGTAKLKLPQSFKGLEVHLYLAFIAEDRSAKSNSLYLGSLEVV